MPSSSRPLAVARAAAMGLLGLCFLPTCALADAQPMLLPSDPAPLVAETGRGEKKFSIEIADDAQEREAGLMFRKSMSERHGMLFVFPEDRHLAFWMKNTPMPLDLVFIGSDGRVEAVLPGKPFSTDTISPREPARFVLELKAGTARKTGIAEGTTMRHPRIDRVAGKS